MKFFLVLLLFVSIQLAMYSHHPRSVFPDYNSYVVPYNKLEVAAVSDSETMAVHFTGSDQYFPYPALSY